MSMKRLKLSDLKLVKEEDEILGNFTSVRGEYVIPKTGKTGFYKLNGCMIGGKNEEDLRELLSSRIMDIIGFPHADILLVSDEQNGEGCLSMSILNENEHFVEPEAQEKKFKPTNKIDDFINKDLEQISVIQGITSEDLRNRKEYLLKYLFVSALISNTDVKMDNMFMIKNDVTGEFRNPEYYDMGVAFVENRDFFNGLSSKQIIEQLYELYPTQVVTFGSQIQEKLKRTDIKALLSEESFETFSKESKNSITNQLFDIIDLIAHLNAKEKNHFRFGIDSLHDASKGVKLSLRDRVSSYLSKFRDKTLGRDIIDE